MARTITQKVVFKDTTVKALYELYMDAKKHSAATGKKAKIKKKEGAKFYVCDHYAKGRNLLLEENKKIVQTWKAKDWTKADADSIVIISFEQKGKDAELELVHANVPDKHAAGIPKGWDDFYWRGWRKYLATKAAEKKEDKKEKKPVKKAAAKKTIAKAAKALNKVATKAVKKPAKKVAKKK